MKIKKLSEREASDFRDQAALAYAASDQQGVSTTYAAANAWYFADEMLKARTASHEEIKMICEECKERKQAAVPPPRTIPLARLETEFKPHLSKKKTVTEAVVLGGFAIASILYTLWSLAMWIKPYLL